MDKINPDICFNKFFQISNDLLCIADKEGCFIKLNPKWEEVLGYKSSELEGKAYIDLVHPDDVESTIKAATDLAKDKEIIDFTNRYRHKDGSYRWLQWHSLPEGDIVFATVRDITEQKKAEETIQKSEEKYRQLFENMTSAFALHEMIYDEEGKAIDYRYVEANPAFEKLTGIPIDSLIGKRVKEVMPNLEDYWVQAFAKVATTGEPYSYMNYAAELGKYYDTYAFSPEKHKFAVVFNDVSSEKKAEEALKQNEELLRGIAKNIPGTVFQFKVDKNGGFGFNFVSDNSKIYLGLDNEDLDKFFERFVERIPKEKHQEFITSVEEAVQKKCSWNFEGTFIKPNGEACYFKCLSNPRELNDELIFDGLYLDITQQKISEKALEESESRARLFVEHTPLPIAIFDTNMCYIASSNHWNAKYKLGDQDIIGRSHYDVFPEIPERWKEDHKRVLKGEIYKNEKDKFVRKDGSEQWLRYELHPWYKGDETIGGLVMFTEDITEKVEIADALKESEQKMQRIYDVAPVGLGIIKDREIIDINSEVCRMSGYSLDELIGKDTKILYSSEEAFERAGQILYREMEQKGLGQVETEWKRKDGKIISVYQNVTAIDPEDITKGVVSTSMDITSRKQYEEQILEKQKLLNEAERIAHMGSWELNIRDNTLFWSDSMFRLYGFDKNTTTPNQELFESIIHPDDKEFVVEKIKNTIVNGEVTDDEYRILRPDGEVRNFLVSAEVVKDEKDNAIKIIGVAQDITEKEETIKALKASEQKLQSLFSITPSAIGIIKDWVFVEINPQLCTLTGYSKEELIGTDSSRLYTTEEEFERVGKELYADITNKGTAKYETQWVRKDGKLIYVYIFISSIDRNDPSKGNTFAIFDMTERHIYEEALEKQVLALTRPIDEDNPIEFTDLFSVDHLQQLQDSFAKATGVASVITHPDGRLITKPSNFCDLCNLVRTTEIGCQNCMRSDSLIGKFNPEGPNIQPCHSAGLWDAGASISVGDVHIASWLIGQVRNETIKEEDVIAYADEIGVDKEEFSKAYNKVTVMSPEQFHDVTNTLYLLANEMSLKSYQNVQQARFIAEQKKYEEELIKAKEQVEESEQKLQRIFEFAPMSIGLLHNRVIDDVNSQVLSLTFFNKEEMIGKSTEVVYSSKEEYERVGGILYQQLEENGLGECEAKWKRKDGKLIDAYIAVTYLDPEDPSKGELFCGIDITRQKKVEQELIKSKEKAEESEYLLKESQRSGNIGSYKLNIETEKWQSTETLNNIFGIPENYERNFNGWMNIIHPEDRDMVTNYFNDEVFDKRHSFDHEYRIVKQDTKELRWVHAIGKLYANNDGVITELLGTIQDITERKLIEEERKMMNVELEKRVEERTNQLFQANKDLESFAYSVSHDLRAPIRHIDGFAHLLEKSLDPEDAKAKNYIDKIFMSSKNMATMIDELLQFSRLGRADLKSRKVNPLTIIEETISRFKPDYEQRKVQWIINDLPLIYGDPVLLRFVFENLISNAIKYTSKKEDAIIEIGEKIVKQSNNVCIFIKDNGAGFDMAYKDKLFGVFQRLHKNEDFEGIGIGLANVKQIIQKHNGEINAEAELNKGATFYITLPKLIEHG